MMELIINISNPVTLILLLIVLLGVVFLGKTSNKSILPGIALGVLSILLVYYAVILRNPNYAEQLKVIYNCLATNFVFLLITFLSYLWVDNAEAKLKNKKMYKTGLEWFFEKKV